MGLIRRHLGVWAFAWLSCQVASLSFAAPIWQSVVAETAECLGTSATDACPMHDGTNNPNASDQCAMRALSHGPAIALATIFSIPAVLLSESRISADSQSAMLTPVAAHLHGTPVSVDSPPPRS